MNDRNEDYFVRRSVSDSDNNKRVPADSDGKRYDMEAYTESENIVPVRTRVKKKKELPEEVALTQSQRNALVKIPEAFSAGSVDMVFLVLLVVLLAFGAVMTFSASYAYGDKFYNDSYYFVEKQLMFMLFGGIAIMLVTLFPLKTYRILTYFIFGFAIILLLLVLVIGVERGGARRWLLIPGLGQFQPSELGKTAVVMMLALYMSKYHAEVESRRHMKSFIFGVLIPGAITLLIGGLVVLENHFSGLIIIFCIGACVMVMGGSKMRFLIPIGLAALALVGLAIMLKGYSSSRITTWLDPWSDPSDSGWQTIQGLYSIASGGIFGVGLGNSRQKYGYVSEPQNDFIFTIVCEELGFVGALAVIVLFFLLIWRGFVIARHSPNRFTYLIVMGLMFKIAFQVGFNIAVVTNTIPNTGISLPFFSSGGTSLLVQMAEMGIVLSISRYSRQKK